MKLLRLLAVGLLALPHLLPAQAAAPRTAAIIVVNRAGPEFDDKLPVVEDLITAKISELGLSIVSPELVINAARTLNPDAAYSLRPTDTLEPTLADSASVVRLAQGLNADYILAASILGFNEQKKNIKAYDNEFTNYTYTLRVSYKLLDATTGASLTGGLAKAVRTEQNTIHVNTGVIESPADATTAPAARQARPARRSAYNADEAIIATVRRFQSAVALVIHMQDGQPVGQATAWAVAPDVFATNAHVAKPAAEFMASGGQVFVALNRNPDRRFRVVSAIHHPRYETVGANAAGRQPVVPYDVGLLRIEGATDTYFPLADEAELRQIDAGYRVGYLGFPMENLIGRGVDPAKPVATLQSGIVTATTDWWQSHGDFEQSQLIQHNLASTGGSSGSPIFNPDGRVVAVHNAGNMFMSTQILSSGKAVMSRAPSAAMINFGQRVDVLRELLGTFQTDTSPAGHSAHTMPAAPAEPAKPRVTFIDPEASAFIDDLLDDATDQIANSLRASLSSGRVAAPTASAKDQNVTITLNVQVSGIQPPAVSLDKDNTFAFSPSPAAVAAEKVDVQVDGVSVGTAPGPITLKKGFSNIRLAHPSLETWQRVINAVDGQTLTATLRLTDEALARWQDYADYLHSLEQDRKLTDAQVEVLKGKAQALRQSGFKVDTDEAPKVENKETIIVK